MVGQGAVVSAEFIHAVFNPQSFLTFYLAVLDRSCGPQTLSCSIWDLVSLTRDGTLGLLRWEPRV